MSLTAGALLLLCIGGAIMFLLRLILNGVSEDVQARIAKGLQTRVARNAHRFLPETKAIKLVEWMKRDIADIRELGGSGIGVALLFLIHTGPLMTWYDRVERRAPKS